MPHHHYVWGHQHPLGAEGGNLGTPISRPSHPPRLTSGKPCPAESASLLSLPLLSCCPCPSWGCPISHRDHFAPSTLTPGVSHESQLPDTSPEPLGLCISHALPSSRMFLHSITTSSPSPPLWSPSYPQRVFLCHPSSALFLYFDQRPPPPGSLPWLPLNFPALSPSFPEILVTLEDDF